MEKAFDRNGLALIHDDGVGVQITYHGRVEDSSDFMQKYKESHPKPQHKALIPGWMPKPSKKDQLRAKRQLNRQPVFVR